MLADNLLFDALNTVVKAGTVLETTTAPSRWDVICLISITKNEQVDSENGKNIVN
jgi:hypothetical protein